MIFVSCVCCSGRASWRFFSTLFHTDKIAESWFIFAFMIDWRVLFTNYKGVVCIRVHTCVQLELSPGLHLIVILIGEHAAPIECNAYSRLEA